MRIKNIFTTSLRSILKTIVEEKGHSKKSNNSCHNNSRFSPVNMSSAGAENTLSSGNKTFKRLPVPVKGQCDKYEYSVIQLNNGLTALLVSDVENLITLGPETDADVSNEVEPSESDESGDESASSADSQDMDVDEHIGEKKNDEKLAALSLTIGVGSFSDGSIPGLAHLLEHMVFMGSAKYPEENDFDAFLASRGGSSNAQTEYETTTFYFDVPEPHLHKSMDIFANFFVEPLLKQESIQGEIEIVDSEFQSSVLNDTARLEQLLATTCDEENPAGKFVWGNLDSLKHGVEENRLYSSLHELRRSRYVANHMTLALQARLDLATLETWVVEQFSTIPSSQSPKPALTLTNSPFCLDRWHRFFTVKPVDQLNELHLRWFTPPVQGLYESKPLDIVSWYLGHEGTGGLVSELRDKRFLATELEAGYESSGFESNHAYAMFSVSITLTDKGVREVKQICDLVFEYISLLSSQLISREQFVEIALINEIGFNYKSAKSSVDYVSELTENMQLYPPLNYLNGDTQFTEYNPALVRQFLRLLSPERVNLSLLSSIACSDPDSRLDQTEPWFKTQYRVDPIEPAWITDWARSCPGSCFELPGPNQFITSDFSLLPAENEVKYPEKILQSDSAEIWFKQTVKYKLPRCIVHFILELPHLSESLASSVLCDVFLNAVEAALQRQVYDAYLAQYYVSIGRAEYGINLSLHGFTQHTDKLLNIVLTHLRHADLPEELFLVAKDTMLRFYVNQLKDSEVLRRALRMGVLVKDSFFIQDKHRTLRDEITYEMFCNFRNTLFERMYVKCLAMGNISRDTTLSLLACLTTTLPFTPLDPGERRQIRIARLEEREKILRVGSLHEKDPNCTVLNYYQSRKNAGELRESCVLEILVEIVSEPLFDTLRTKQKLGYYVNATVRDTFGVLGLSVLVESQMSKHSVDVVEARIHEFVSRYVRDNETTIRAKYEEYIGTLVKKKKMVEINLKEEASRHFDEIKIDDYMFDRQEKELELIQNIDLDEILEWIDENVVEKHKKLSIQIVGTVDENSDASQQTAMQDPVSNEHKRKHSDSDDLVSTANNKQLIKTADKTQLANNKQLIETADNAERKNGGHVRSANHLEDSSVDNLANGISGEAEGRSIGSVIKTPSTNTALPSINNKDAPASDAKTPSINSDKALSKNNEEKTLIGEKAPSIDEKAPSLNSKETLVSNKSSDYIAIEYLVPCETDDRFIKDVKEYRKTLQFYPVMKLK